MSQVWLQLNVFKSGKDICELVNQEKYTHCSFPFLFSLFHQIISWFILVHQEDMGDMGGMGGLGGLFNDPEMMAAFADPEVAAAFKDISANPANIMKYQNNPKVGYI